MSQHNDVRYGSPAPSQYSWLIWVLFGALSTVVGVWLMLSPRAAIGTLALLLGFGLIFNGVAQFGAAGHHPSPVLAYTLAALYIIAGIVVFFRPAAGLFGLALVVGVSLIITGLAELYIAFSARDHIEHWLFMAFIGAVGIIAGVLAIAWPAITVAALALLLGIRLVVAGLVQIGIGLGARTVAS